MDEGASGAVGRASSHVTGDRMYYVVSSGDDLDAISALYGYRVGTGGIDESLLLQIAGLHASHPTTASVVYENRVAKRSQPTEPVSSRVNAIRNAFGLTVTDLAGVLRVERPTVYSWLKDSAVPNPSRSQRIDALLRLAVAWVKSAGPDRKPDLQARTPFGPTLIEALRDDTLREFVLREHLALNGRVQGGDRLPVDFAAIARQAGIAERSSFDYDVETGRPLSRER